MTLCAQYPTYKQTRSKNPSRDKIIEKLVSTVASSNFGPYHGLWLDDAQTKHLGIIPTAWTMMDALGLV